MQTKGTGARGTADLFRKSEEITKCASLDYTKWKVELLFKIRQDSFVCPSGHNESLYS